MGGTGGRCEAGRLPPSHPRTVTAASAWRPRTSGGPCKLIGWRACPTKRRSVGPRRGGGSRPPPSTVSRKNHQRVVDGAAAAATTGTWGAPRRWLATQARDGHALCSEREAAPHTRRFRSTAAACGRLVYLPGGTKIERLVTGLATATTDHFCDTFQTESGVQSYAVLCRCTSTDSTALTKLVDFGHPYIESQRRERGGHPSVAPLATRACDGFLRWGKKRSVGESGGVRWTRTVESSRLDAVAFSWCL